jgi:hypothetical protein
MHRGRESSRCVTRDTEGVLAVLEGMVPRSCAIRSARITCVGFLGRGPRLRTKFGCVVVDGLLSFLWSERTRGDGRGRVDGLSQVEVGRRVGGFRWFGKVGGWTCAWVKRLKASRCIECDAEVASEWWAEGCRTGFRVDLGQVLADVAGRVRREEDWAEESAWKRGYHGVETSNSILLTWRTILAADLREFAP